MDEETVQLVQRLCTEAGTLMEDLNPTALMTPRDPEGLRIVIDELSRGVERMLAIVEAARALLG